MPPLVSIVIPAFNAQAWLSETLASVLAQTWPHREVIVVDDGSRDATLDVARRFESDGLRVIAQANQGASSARNAGLRVARGDFIQFLDADDLLAPDKIERQVLRAAAVPPDTLLSAAWRRFRKTPGDLPACPEVLSADFPPVDWAVAKFEHHAMVHPAAWLMTRTLADRIGPWDESLTLDDDGEYFTRAALASAGLVHCPDALSWYRSGLPASLSRSRSEAAWASAFRSVDLSARLLLSHEDSPRVRRACAGAYQRFIHESYPCAAACRRLAAAEVARLGGTSLEPEGGPRRRLLRRLLGWRLAKRLTLLLD